MLRGLGEGGRGRGRSWDGELGGRSEWRWVGWAFEIRTGSG